MLVILSPAKTLDFDPAPYNEYSQPRQLEDTQRLVKKMRVFSVKRLMKLMGVSQKIAALNVDRYQAFELPLDLESAKQSLLAFKGDTYRDMGLDAYSDEDFQHAQKRIRILSGLYGVLRPLDLIRPYRLEMGTRLKTRRGTDLYRFWGDRITKQLNADLAELQTDTVINLASKEYFKSIRADKLKARVIDVAFKDFKNGTYKVISFFAKRARGAMASAIVRERIRDVGSLRDFSWSGYQFDEAESGDEKLVFHRKQD